MFARHHYMIFIILTLPFLSMVSSWQVEVNKLEDFNENLDTSQHHSIIDISLGPSSTCVFLDSGNISCWGFGFEHNTPTELNIFGEGRTVSAIAMGDGHTCAILDNGSVSCWGVNQWGQIGDGTIGNSKVHTPTQTESFGEGRTAVSISSGGENTCVILDDDSVRCWGRYWPHRNNTGDMVGAIQNPLQGIGNDIVEIATGSNYRSGAVSHDCAILDNGSVICWGDNDNFYGQLGDVYLGNGLWTTSSFGEGRTAVAISAGAQHTCVILDNGSVSCWGNNLNGQIGDGTIHSRYIPTQTESFGEGRSAIMIASGDYHTCVILDNGSVSCWGWNQLNSESRQGTPTHPGSFGEGRSAITIASGKSHVCVILDNGTVSCWGSNGYGQLGNGTSGAGSENPIPIPEEYFMIWSQKDSDSDGVINGLDDFPNDSSESTDTDGDGIGDNADTDDDGDTYGDELEEECESNPLDSQDVPLDTDMDSICDVIDEDDDGDLVTDVNDFCPQGEIGWTSGAAIGTDLDGDGCRDAGEDLDDDGDGVSDTQDSCPLGQTGWISNSVNDNDGDGCQDNGEDLDDDGDGVNDNEDDYPNDPNKWSDIEADGNGDDSNGGGIIDNIDESEDSGLPGFGLILTLISMISATIVISKRRR